MAHSSMSLSVSLCLCLCVCWMGGLAHAEFPDTESFLRAGLWRATAIDGYIYLDGGEVSQEGNTAFRKANMINSTLSINCNTSWSPASVDIREIPRGDSQPVLDHQTLFTHEASGSFYVWGGSLSFLPTADFSLLWRFFADGEGGGQWHSEAPENQDVFAGINRTETAAYASTEDAAFIFGGRTVDESGKVGSSSGSVTGFNVFNFTTMEWEVVEGGEYSHDGSIWGGSATFVPTFGAKGIIVMLGGLERAHEPGSGYIDWGAIHVYDVAEKKWHRQKASGKAPERRSHHCAVGVADTGDNGSYEIFIYGGANRDQRVEYGSMYALSIPGFTWTQVSDDEARNRTDHTCVNVNGNSQLVTLGGLNFQKRREREWESKDPHPRGIAIFNMNNLSWADSYDAGADEYKTHGDIRSWYDQGGLEGMDWTDDEVRALFTGRTSNQNNENGSGSRDGGEDTSGNNSSSTPVGAIAGGVVGGVVGLALIGLAVWFFLRRRQQASELDGQGTISELQLSKPPPSAHLSELDQSTPPAELPPPPERTAVAEMVG